MGRFPSLLRIRFTPLRSQVGLASVDLLRRWVAGRIHDLGGERGQRTCNRTDLVIVTIARKLPEISKVRMPQRGDRHKPRGVTPQEIKVSNDLFVRKQLENRLLVL